MYLTQLLNWIHPLYQDLTLVAERGETPQTKTDRMAPDAIAGTVYPLAWDNIVLRFPAVLSVNNQSCFKIWAIARAIDCRNIVNKNGSCVPNGSGLVQLNVNHLAAFFERSVVTIRRWLCDAARRGYLYRYEIRDDIARIEYVGLVGLCLKLGFTELGTIAKDYPLEALREPRFWGVQATAEDRQQQSWFAAKNSLQDPHEQVRGGMPKNSVEVERPKDRLTCPQTEEGKLGEDARYIYLDENAVPFGASQEGIGQALGLSDRQVRRTLSNAVRRRKGLPLIHKRQQVQHMPDVRVEVLHAMASSSDRELQKELPRYLVVKGRVFYKRTNLYYPETSFASSRFRRESLRWWVQAIESGREKIKMT